MIKYFLMAQFTFFFVFGLVSGTAFSQVMEYRDYEKKTIFLLSLSIEELGQIETRKI